MFIHLKTRRIIIIYVYTFKNIPIQIEGVMELINVLLDPLNTSGKQYFS